MAKLAGTSAAQIALTFLVMNLQQALRLLFFALCWLLSPALLVSPSRCNSRG